MSKALKPKNNEFIDSTGITHKRSVLYNILEDYLLDSGWQPITLNTTAYVPTGSPYPLRARKIGKVVYLEGLASGNVNAIKDTTIGYVPFPPSRKLYFSGGSSFNEDNSGNKAKCFTIDTTGKIVAHGSSYVDNWVTFSGISYLVD